MNRQSIATVLAVLGLFVASNTVVAANNTTKQSAKVVKTANKKTTAKKSANKKQAAGMEGMNHAGMNHCGMEGMGEGHQCPMMEARKNANYVPTPSENTLTAMHKPMMDNKLVESGNVEHDFLANMVPHHQGAVDSSKLVLEHGKSKKVQKIAKNIIKAQEKEIAQFNKHYTI